MTEDVWAFFLITCVVMLYVLNRRSVTRRAMRNAMHQVEQDAPHFIAGVEKIRQGTDEIEREIEATTQMRQMGSSKATSRMVSYPRLH